MKGSNMCDFEDAAYGDSVVFWLEQSLNEFKTLREQLTITGKLEDYDKLYNVGVKLSIAFSSLTKFSECFERPSTLHEIPRYCTEDDLKR